MPGRGNFGDGWTPRPSRTRPITYTRRANLHGHTHGLEPVDRCERHCRQARLRPGVGHPVPGRLRPHCHGGKHRSSRSSARISSTSSPTLWRWTATDGLNLSVYTVGPDGPPVGMNDSFNPKIQVFEFDNPTGLVTLTGVRSDWRSGRRTSKARSRSRSSSPSDLRCRPISARTSRTGQGSLPLAPPHSVASGPLPGHISRPSPGLELGLRRRRRLSTEQNPVHNFTVGPDEIRQLHGDAHGQRLGTGPQQSVAHEESGSIPAISVKFASNVTEGPPPLTVQFWDQTTGFPTNWLWNFQGDGGGGGDVDRAEPNPYLHGGGTVLRHPLRRERHQHRYHSADEKTYPIYIRVGDPVRPTSWGTPLFGEASLPVQFTDLSTGPVMRYQWLFGDGGVGNRRPTMPTAPLRNPGQLHGLPEG